MNISVGHNLTLRVQAQVQCVAVDKRDLDRVRILLRRAQNQRTDWLELAGSALVGAGISFLATNADGYFGGDLVTSTHWVIAAAILLIGVVILGFNWKDHKVDSVNIADAIDELDRAADRYDADEAYRHLPEYDSFKAKMR